MGRTTTTVVVTMGSEMMTGETLGYSTEMTESGWRGYVARRRPGRQRGVGASNARKNDDGRCTDAECVVRLREQDCLFDDARPWVIFAPQDEGHDQKMYQDRRRQDDADRLGSYGGGGVDRVGRDWRRGSWARDDDHYCYGNDEDVYGGGGSGGAMRLDKLVLQSIEASEQCERLDVPRIEQFTVSDVRKLSNKFAKTIYSHGALFFPTNLHFTLPRLADPPSPSPPPDSLPNASQCARYQNSSRTTNLRNRGHRQKIRINTGTPNFGLGIPKPKWGYQYQNGDPQTKMGMRVARIPISVWGSQKQNWDQEIPIPKRGSPNRNGVVQSLTRIGLGFVPIRDFRFESPNWNGIQIGDPILVRGSPNRFG